MPSYTEEELNAVELLRQKLMDLELDEEKNSKDYLVRWLQAQNLDVNKAEEMLRKSLIWRKENNIDSILEWKAPPNFKKAFPSEVCGYDAEGNAIVLVPMKYFNTNLFYEIEKSDYVKFRIQLLEKILEGMKRRNKSGLYKGCRLVTIHDLEEFNLRNVMNGRSMEYMREVGKLLDDNYPEINRAAYITFAPRMISFVISVVKPFLPKGAINKARIYGSDVENWATEILKDLPANALPVRYGGTNTEFDMNIFTGLEAAALIN